MKREPFVWSPLFVFALSGCGHVEKKAPQDLVVTAERSAAQGGDDQLASQVAAEDLNLANESNVFCPAGSRFLPSHSLCMTDTDAIGPFPPKMQETCKSYGGGDATCEGMRWNVDFAKKMRGTGQCAPGTLFDPNLKTCIAGGDAYGPFTMATVDKCLANGGGEPCRGMRIAKSFIVLEADPVTTPSDGVPTVPGLYTKSYGASYRWRFPNNMERTDLQPSAESLRIFAELQRIAKQYSTGNALLFEQARAEGQGIADRDGYPNTPCAAVQSALLRQLFKRLNIDNGFKGDPLVTTLNQLLAKMGWVVWDSYTFIPTPGSIGMNTNGISPSHTYMIAGLPVDPSKGIGAEGVDFGEYANGMYIFDNAGSAGRNLSKLSAKTVADMYNTGGFWLPPGIVPLRRDAVGKPLPVVVNAGTVQSKIALLMASSTEVSHSYKLGGASDSNKAKVVKVNGGQLYIKADMDIDADGSPRAREIDPCEGCGQIQTSLSKSNGWQGVGQYVNSEEIPYFVIPLKFQKSHGDIGMKLGDLGVVLFNGRMEYAIYADEGPTTIIGEGSIFLSQALGNNPFINGIIQRGIGYGVEYLVFPGSSAGGIPRNLSEIRTRGKALVEAFLVK